MKSRQNKMRRLRGSFDRFRAQFESLEDRRLMTVAPVVSDVAAVAAPVVSTQSLVAAPADLVAGTAASTGIVVAPAASATTSVATITPAPPVISLPITSIPVNGGNSTPIQGIEVFGDGFGNLMVTISVQHGTLQLPDEFGLSVSGDGTSSITLIGSQWAIDAALGGVSEVTYPFFSYPVFDDYPFGNGGFAGPIGYGATVVGQGLDYTADAGYTGTDSLSVSAQQLAFSGGPVYPYYPFEPIYPIFDPFFPFEPIYEPFFPPPVVCMPGTVMGGVATQPGSAATFSADAATDPASMPVGQADSLATSDIVTSNVVSTGIVGWPIWSYPDWEYLPIVPYGPSAVATSTLTLDVKSQVLPPTINVPSTQVTTPTAPIVFSAAGGNAISITDSGVGTQPIQVTLSTNFATLTLGSTAGVTISDDGNDSSYVTITGSVTAINSALDGLVFTPGGNYGGYNNINISVDDLGNTSWGQPLTADTCIGVDERQLEVPAGQSVNQGSTLVFNSANGNAISAGSISVAGGSEQLQLSVADGTLTLGNTAGLTFISGGNGTNSMSVTGSIADLNNALAGLTYTPDAGFVGSDDLSIGLNNLSGLFFWNQEFSTADVSIQVEASTSTQAPKVTPSGTTNTFAVGGAAVPVDLGVMVSSSDTDLTGATVTISPGTLQAGDTLNFINQNGITGNYSNGVLSLSGSATPTQYAAALQSVTFSTTSTVTTARAISIVALDNAITSNSASETVDVTAPVTVTAPVVTPSGTTNTFTVGGTAVAVDPGVTVTSNDSDLTGATVTISPGTLQTGDALNFTNQNGIVGSFSGGVLTLSGSATPAQYQAALQSITFSTTSSSPVARSLSIVALDNGLTSNTAAESVNLVAPPVVTPSGTTNTFTLGGAAVAVDSGVTVSSGDTDLTGATVTISSSTLQTGDTLNFVNQNGITGNFSGGVLTLSGSATPAQYQTALQSITFSTTSTDTTTRAISIVALDNGLTSTTAAESVAVSGTANQSVRVTKNAMPIPTPDTDHGFEHGHHGFATTSATSAATLVATTGSGSTSSGASTNGAASSSSRSGHSFAAVDAAIADFDLTDLSI